MANASWYTIQCSLNSTVVLRQYTSESQCPQKISAVNRKLHGGHSRPCPLLFLHYCGTIGTRCRCKCMWLRTSSYSTRRMAGKTCGGKYRRRRPRLCCLVSFLCSMQPKPEFWNTPKQVLLHGSRGHGRVGAGNMEKFLVLQVKIWFERTVSMFQCRRTPVFTVWRCPAPSRREFLKQVHYPLDVGRYVGLVEAKFPPSLETAHECQAVDKAPRPDVHTLHCNAV